VCVFSFHLRLHEFKLWLDDQSESVLFERPASKADIIRYLPRQYGLRRYHLSTSLWAKAYVILPGKSLQLAPTMKYIIVSWLKKNIKQLWRHFVTYKAPIYSRVHFKLHVMPFTRRCRTIFSIVKLISTQDIC